LNDIIFHHLNVISPCFSVFSRRFPLFLCCLSNPSPFSPLPKSLLFSFSFPVTYQFGLDFGAICSTSLQLCSMSPLHYGCFSLVSQCRRWIQNEAIPEQNGHIGKILKLSKLCLNSTTTAMCYAIAT